MNAEIPLASIVPNQRQPRTYFNEQAVQELAASIRAVGILQPLVVRRVSEGKYELIAGERRFRAAKLAGLATVPVLIREANDQDSLELALIENLQREDITPVESAKAYRKLIDGFGMTQEAVAEKVGKSRVAIANTVRLLKLPQRVLEGLERGQLTEAHARALLGFPNQAIQLAVYEQILERGMTVKQVERMSAQAATRKSRKKGSSHSGDPNWLSLRENLSMSLGAPVKLEGSGGKGGRIVIEFFSEDDLARIVESLGLEE